ncbi:hypothetical protein SRS16P2_00464 (plasmid) [Variovorax sp. SRS16]|uniref:hypothetical protein n=1 Tax=Variovorax sp. SRS16 TaxID=282217 RepID=UPI00131978CD|nr:hypothetical protein [Variovorax sp. SRS16]VTU46061.1 hypothetical protein SRS16P2_00464 [Variovorax sp. SRS16]
MAATPEEVAALRRTFEQDHRKPARALAELLLMGNVLLESHEALEGRLGERFEAFVLESLDDEGVSHAEFARAVQALQDLRATLANLDELPD